MNQTALMFPVSSPSTACVDLCRPNIVSLASHTVRIAVWLSPGTSSATVRMLEKSLWRAGNRCTRSPTVETPMFSKRLTFFFHTPLMDDTPSDIFSGAWGTRRRCGLRDGGAGRLVDSGLGGAGARPLPVRRLRICSTARSAHLERSVGVREPYAGMSSRTWPSSGDARFRNASSPPITALSSKPLACSWRSMLYRDRAKRSELVTGLRDG